MVHRPARWNHQFPARIADFRDFGRSRPRRADRRRLVYNPANDDMFIAEKGQGAYLNNRRLRVAARRDMADALIGCGVPHIGKAKEHPRFKAELASVMAKAANIRRLGAAALDLCFVASGNFDGFWERDLQPWDIAAGIIMIKEAGGFVTDADGGNDMLSQGSICAGNDVIQRNLLDLIRAALARRPNSPLIAGARRLDQSRARSRSARPLARQSGGLPRQHHASSSRAAKPQGSQFRGQGKRAATRPKSPNL